MVLRTSMQGNGWWLRIGNSKQKRLWTIDYNCLLPIDRPDIPPYITLNKDKMFATSLENNFGFVQSGYLACCE